MKIMHYFIKKNLVLLLITFLLLFFQVIGTLWSPLLVAQLIDYGISKHNVPVIRFLGIKMVLVSLIAAITSIIGSYFSAKVAAQFGFQIRKMYFSKIQALPSRDIESFGTGSLLTRMTNDIDNIQQVIILFLQQILPAPLIGIISVYITYKYSPKLSLVFIVALVIFSLFVYFLLKKGLPLSLIIQPKMDTINMKLREFLNGIVVIRGYNQHDHEEKQMNKLFSEYANSMMRVNYIFALLTPLSFLLMGIAFAAIIWFGGPLISIGNLQVGAITAIIEFTLLTLAYFLLAAMVLVMIPRAFTSLKRIEEILDISENQRKLNSSELNESFLGDKNLFKLKEVSFAYSEDAEAILKNISLDIPKGEVSAIIGGTGSGKSTLIKLLLGLNEATEGSISFQGKDIRSLSKKELRSRISYVPQKSFLFSGTIKSNLLMGNPDATKENMDKAISIAQLRPFIKELNDGYNTSVAQGGKNFSGGQRQRLCIARALIKPADLYVFDDSFSALDYKTDSTLRSSLKKEMSDKSLLIVAQRLSVIQEADNIIILEKGEIMGQGTHDELLKHNKTYREIAISQGVITKGETV